MYVSVLQSYYPQNPKWLNLFNLPHKKIHVFLLLYAYDSMSLTLESVSMNDTMRAMGFGRNTQT